MMPLKNQLNHLKKAKKLAKQKKLKIKNDILKEDTFILFKNELIEGS